MPPPSCSSEDSNLSAKDQESDFDYETSKIKSCKTFCKEESQPSTKRETVKLMKSFLGPSLEDAVLKTLEFGKTIINKPNPAIEVTSTHRPSKEDKLLNVLRKKIAGNSQSDLDLNYLFEEGRKLMKEKKNSKRKSERKSLALKNKMEKNFCQKPFMKKLGNVSKIRSLDSDLKQEAPSPEKIKRQLEALIQINKSEVSKHGGKWNLGFKVPKFPVEMTIMPSLCMYKNEANIQDSCEMQSTTSRQECECDIPNPRTCESTREKCLGKISQAPEFITNALGPSLDVSIIENLKMMRDIFKCESGKGEEPQKHSACKVKQEVRLQSSETEMSCKIEALQKRIEELEHKEHYLTKQIEDEECERECKRKAFEEEERKICAVKSCFEKLSGREDGDSHGMEGGLEALKMKIICEEETLMRLKNQTDCFKRELAEIKCKRDALKRNKSLLDAWDVFASRVCHTKLPSFSRVINLERKQLKDDDDGNLHCCFPTLSNHQSKESIKETKICPSRCGHSETQCNAKHKCQGSNHCNHLRGSCSDVSRCASKEKTCGSKTSLKLKIKMGEIQFPVQRDIFCGLHQVLKSCTCKAPIRHEGHVCSSEDDLRRKLKNMKSKCGHESHCKVHSVDSSGKKIMHSKSDTSLKVNKCPKIVKVMWATTRINVFQDNSRTYEVMDTTANPPSCLPVRTEGIFVVKNAQKKVCGSSSRRHCTPCISGF